MVTARQIGDRIRARIKYLKLTQVAVAKEFGCTRGAFNNYLSGKREFSSTDLSRLADLLGVKITYFYEDDQPDKYDPRGNRPDLIAFYDGLSDFPDAQDDLVSMARAIWERKRAQEHVHGRKATDGEEDEDEQDTAA